MGYLKNFPEKNFGFLKIDSSERVILYNVKMFTISVFTPIYKKKQVYIMKKYRITESRLRNLIQESVKRILGESCWYGDTKPFEQIIDAANKIMQSFEYVNAEDYEPWDDCDGADLDPQIYQWAKKVAGDAEYYMRSNSSYASINGGEGW